MKKDCYITLDYELFLNDLTGDVEKCLIIPTEKLLNLLSRYDVKATFFVDASYLLRLTQLMGEHPSLQRDFEIVEKQINRIRDLGHTIALHIHPQWFYSLYDGVSWRMDFDHYKLSDMSKEEADEKFEQCLKLLKALSQADIRAYRAGGYSIQTYQSFPNILVNSGLLVDSSVLCGMKNQTHLHYFDYSTIKYTTIYTFDKDVLSPNTDGNGMITEYPITTAKMSFVRYCYYKIKNSKIVSNNNWGNGGDLPSKRKRAFINNILKKLFMPVFASASIDYQSFTFTDYVLKKNGKKSTCIVIIGHPKNFSPASLSYLEELLHNNEYSFKSI